jgi:hypothetical protein
MKLTRLLQLNCVPFLLIFARLVAAESHEHETTSAELSKDEIQVIENALHEMDADDFATRVAAKDKIARLGLRAKPYLSEHLKLHSAKDSAEVLFSIERVINAIERAENERIVKEIVAGLDDAIKDAPRKFIPPDRQIAERLENTRVTFDFVDTELKSAIDLMIEKTGLVMVLDPACKEDCPNMNLHVNQMSARLALDWIGKLADLEVVVRGKAIILTKRDRAEKLRLQERTHTLPVFPGEAAWTAEETTALANLLVEWPLVRDESNQAYWHAVRPERCAMSKAGEISVDGQETQHERVDKFIHLLADASSKPEGLPDAIVATEKSLDEKLKEEIPELSLADAVLKLGQLTHINVILDPKVQAKGEDQKSIKLTKSKGIEAREVVLELCEKASLCASVHDEGLFLGEFPNTPSRPRVLEISAVLKAGISGDAIQSLLDNLQSQNRYYLTSFSSTPKMGQVLRSRLFMAMDDSAYHCMVEMLEEAGKTGQLPPLKAPWFYKTFKNHPDGEEQK